MFQQIGPESISEDDIDINLSFVHFDNLQLAGGFFFHAATILSNFGSRMVVALNGEVPRLDVDQNDDWDTPVIIVSRSGWLADLADKDADTTIAGYAHTATPGPNVQDATIIDGYNRIYKRDDVVAINAYINGIRLEWTDRDWRAITSTNDFFALLHYLPVQDYSAPSAFQRPVMEDMNAP